MVLEGIVGGASTIQNPEIDGCECISNCVENSVGVRITGRWSQRNGCSGRLDWSPRYLMKKNLDLRRRVLYSNNRYGAGFVGPVGTNLYPSGGSQSRQAELAHGLQESSLESSLNIAERSLQTERLSKFLHRKCRPDPQQARLPLPWSPQSC